MPSNTHQDARHDRQRGSSWSTTPTPRSQLTAAGAPELAPGAQTTNRTIACYIYLAFYDAQGAPGLAPGAQTTKHTIVCYMCLVFYDAPRAPGLAPRARTTKKKHSFVTCIWLFMMPGMIERGRRSSGDISNQLGSYSTTPTPRSQSKVAKLKPPRLGQKREKRLRQDHPPHI